MDGDDSACPEFFGHMFQPLYIGESAKGNSEI